MLSRTMAISESSKVWTSVLTGVCGGHLSVCLIGLGYCLCITNKNRIITVQFLALLPTFFAYMLPKEGTADNRLPVLQWPSGFSTNRPGHCLSYNPHSRGAAQSSCMSVKVDLWLHGTDLLVGSSVTDFNMKYTLRSLYFDPLQKELDAKRNALKDSQSQPKLFGDSTQSFVLVLEFKTWQHAALSELDSDLYGLRQSGYLTWMNGSEVIPGPVTVVVTGQREHYLRSGHDAEYNEIFFDTLLDELTMKDYDPWKLTHRDPPKSNTSSTNILKPNKGLSTGAPSSTIYSATATFSESVGFPRQGRFSPQQIALIRAQVQAAHRRGLWVRYEGVPQGQGRLSDYIWRILVREGVDMIDVDWQAAYHRAWWQRWFTNHLASD